MKKPFICVAITVLCLTALCGCFGGVPEEKTEVPNPVVEYESLEEINKKIDFTMLALPEQYTPESYSVIDGTIAQMEYKFGEEAVINFRMAEGKDDISGIYGIEYEQTILNGVQVQTGLYNDIHVAWFTYEPYTYALTGTDMNGTDFTALLNTVTTLISSPEAEEPQES